MFLHQAIEVGEISRKRVSDSQALFPWKEETTGKWNSSPCIENGVAEQQQPSVISERRTRKRIVEDNQRKRRCAGVTRWNINNLFVNIDNPRQTRTNTPNEEDGCATPIRRPLKDSEVADNEGRTPKPCRRVESKCENAAVDGNNLNSNRIAGQRLIGGSFFNLFCQTSRSRDLVYANSLLLEAVEVQTSLWLSIGERRRAVNAWITTLSIVARRIRFPLCVVYVLLRLLSIQLQLVPLKCLADHGFDSATAAAAAEGSDEAEGDDSDGLLTKQQRAMKLLWVCLDIAEILLPIVEGESSIRVKLKEEIPGNLLLVSLWPTNYLLSAPINSLVKQFRGCSSSNSNCQAISMGFPDFWNTDAFLDEMKEVACRLLEMKNQELEEKRKAETRNKSAASSRSSRRQQPPLQESFPASDASVSDSSSEILSEFDRLFSSSSANNFGTVAKMLALLEVFLKKSSNAGTCSNLIERMTGKALGRPGNFICTIAALLTCLIGLKLAKMCFSQKKAKALGSLALDCVNLLVEQQSLPVASQSILTSITTSIILLISQHLRCFWMFRFRHIQKQSRQNADFLTVEDTVEFLLRHHAQSAKKFHEFEAFGNDGETSDAEFNKKDKNQQNANEGSLIMEIIPFVWAVIHLEVQRKDQYRRLRCWRYFGRKIVRSVLLNTSMQQTSLAVKENDEPHFLVSKREQQPQGTTSKKVRQKASNSKAGGVGRNRCSNNNDNKNNSANDSENHDEQQQQRHEKTQALLRNGLWVSLSTEWIEESEWNEVERQIEILKRKNIGSTKAEEMHGGERNAKNRQEKKTNEKKAVQEWWNQR